MGQSVAIIIIIIFLAFLFIPMALLTNNQFQLQDVKHSLNLSGKALINSIDEDFTNTVTISEGFNRSSQDEISIDKDKLLEEFYDVLYKNYYQEEVFEEIKSKLLLKILVMPDRFYVANLQDQWSPPYFFTYQEGDKLFYLNTADNNTHYYDIEGNKIQQPIEIYGITKEMKNQIIIDQINKVIATQTALEDGNGQLAIEIRNPYILEFDYQRKYKNFNVLEGITFFVIYREDEGIVINNKEFNYRNYNVVGYTLR